MKLDPLFFLSFRHLGQGPFSPVILFCPLPSLEDWRWFDFINGNSPKKDCNMCTVTGEVAELVSPAWMGGGSYVSSADALPTLSLRFSPVR